MSLNVLHFMFSYHCGDRLSLWPPYLRFPVDQPSSVVVPDWT